MIVRTRHLESLHPEKTDRGSTVWEWNCDSYSHHKQKGALMNGHVSKCQKRVHKVVDNILNNHVSFILH